MTDLETELEEHRKLVDTMQLELHEVQLALEIQRKLAVFLKPKKFSRLDMIQVDGLVADCFMRYKVWKRRAISHEERFNGICQD